MHRSDWTLPGAHPLIQKKKNFESLERGAESASLSLDRSGCTCDLRKLFPPTLRCQLSVICENRK